MPPETFQNQVDQFRNVIETLPPARVFDRVQHPGDLEANTRLARAETGIPVPEPTWNDLVQLAATLGISPDGEAVR